VKAGDRIVADGLNKLQPGQPVRVVGQGRPPGAGGPAGAGGRPPGGPRATHPGARPPA
jgi:hypothetical protein